MVERGKPPGLVSVIDLPGFRICADEDAPLVGDDDREIFRPITGTAEGTLDEIRGGVLQESLYKGVRPPLLFHRVLSLSIRFRISASVIRLWE